MFKHDLTNQKFGKLSVTSFSHTKKNKNDYVRYWNCICDCGITCIKNQKLLLNGKTKSCGCFRIESGKKRYKGCGQLSKSHWNSIIRHAKDRDILVEITIEDAWNIFTQQNGYCKLTGLKLQFAGSRAGENCGETTASLDRIDSSKEYSLDNIQWIHKDVQRMKWSFNEHYFKYMCQLITKYNSI